MATRMKGSIMDFPLNTLAGSTHSSAVDLEVGVRPGQLGDEFEHQAHNMGRPGQAPLDNASRTMPGGSLPVVEAEPHAPAVLPGGTALPRGTEAHQLAAQAAARREQALAARQAAGGGPKVIPTDTTKLLTPEQRAAAAHGPALQAHNDLIRTMQTAHNSVDPKESKVTGSFIEAQKSALQKSIDHLNGMKPGEVGYDAAKADVETKAASLRQAVTDGFKESKSSETTVSQLVHTTGMGAQIVDYSLNAASTLLGFLRK